VAAHEVFIISDLHIGGRFPETEGDRGFRMMTRPDVLTDFIKEVATKAKSAAENEALPTIELVINGDFIDFLAESHQDDNGQPVWVPFIENPERAVAVFKEIADRGPDAPIFDALAALLEAGGQLTILLGNHDLELSLPPVRAAFEQRIGLQPHHRYRFLYDGEAYIVGDALIEHGNRYDSFNVVNHDALRRLRSFMSRHQHEHLGRAKFRAPAGSHVVAEVMNPFKADYAFVDLLKPESEAFVALILALEPDTRKDLARLATLAAEAATHGMAEPAVSKRKGDIASTGGSTGRPRGMASGMASRTRPRRSEGDDALREALAQVWSPEVLESALSTTRTAAGQDIAGGLPAGVRGVLDLFRKGHNQVFEDRLEQVRQAVRALEDPDKDFSSSSIDKKGRYFKAARDLAIASGEQRFRYVVFGHTHFAKDVPVQEGEEDGPRYLNTGTWANLMRFPKKLFSESELEARDALEAFFVDLLYNRLQQYIEFHPTYVRLAVGDDGRVAEAKLNKFDADTRELA